MAKNHKLIAFIADQKLNQTSFAEAIGVNRQTVISWINRNKGVSLSSLYAISNRFGMGLTEVNEQLDLGVQLSEADTAIEKLYARIEKLEASSNFAHQERLEKLEAWFGLPRVESLEKGKKFDTRNFIIGSLHNRNLCVIDLLTETTTTVSVWKNFIDTGEISQETLSDIIEWLDTDLPFAVPGLGSSTKVDKPVSTATKIEKPVSTASKGTRRRSSFSTRN